MISRMLAGLAAVPDLGQNLSRTIQHCESIYQLAERDVLEAAFLRPNMIEIKEYQKAVTAPEINSFMKDLSIRMARERELMEYTLGGHLKTGQLGSPQNRPVRRTQDNLVFTLPVAVVARCF